MVGNQLACSEEPAVDWGWGWIVKAVLVVESLHWLGKVKGVEAECREGWLTGWKELRLIFLKG